MIGTAGLVTLFLVAFGAATVLPMQSEVVFVATQVSGAASLPVLIAVASVGNTLGSIVNYALGRGASRFGDRRWFPVRPAQLAQAQDWYARWGVWTLLLSWAPLGDAFTVLAGLMRTPLWLFVTLVGIAKTVRYVVLAWLTARVAGG